MEDYNLSIIFQAPKGSNLDKTTVTYELILQPEKKPTDVDYKKEYSLRRLEKMQFPTKDDGFKRRLLAGGARDVSNNKDSEKGKDSDRKDRDKERRKNLIRTAPSRHKNKIKFPFIHNSSSR